MLLLVSLGPIQDFIASARRCQDLWFGSWMLSDLSRAAAEAIGLAAGGAQPLVFPGDLSTTEARRPAVANKILAVLPPDLSADRVARAGQSAMTERLRQLAARAYGRLTGLDHFHASVANAQLADLMEFLWVAVPLGASYGDARSNAEALLARRKNTRTWGPVPWTARAGAGVPKSSLDGLRESVLDERLYTEISRSDHPAALRFRYGLKGMERLCGVGVLKRFGVRPEFWSNEDGRRPTFHSTSHIAAAPLLTRLARRSEGERGVRALRDWLGHRGVDGLRVQAGVVSHAMVTDLLLPDAFEPDPASAVKAPRVFLQSPEGNGLDGVLMFDNRAEEILDEAWEGDYGDKDVQGLARAVVVARDAMGLKGPPTPYYAVLLADGDRMGKALDLVADLDRHRELGHALETFAARCEALVASAGGSLIYAGGDDVLALLPLHTALQCAFALKEAFAAVIQPLFPDLSALQAKDPDFTVPTLSVGLAIAHHMEDMADARALAKVAEKRAKDGGRNALAVVMSKRSGGTHAVVGAWSEARPLHQRLAHWARRLHDRSLPHGAAYLLAEALKPWDHPDTNPEALKDAEKAAIRALVKRVIARRRSDRGRASIDTEVRDELESYLADHNILLAARQLSAELQIARLFLDARNDAFEDHRNKEDGEVP